MAYQTIDITKRGDILIVRLLKERIYLNTAEKFRDEFVPLLDQEIQHVVLNFEKVNVMNSSGLGVLIMARDKLDKKKHIIAVCGIRSVMKDIFLRMRLDLLFNLYETEDKAVADIERTK